MGSVAFVGCSFFAGSGLDSDEILSENLWVNICHKRFAPFNKLKLINGAIGGSSNADIFKNSLFLLTTIPDLKYLICGWTSMPRFNFNVGFELYDTNAGLHQHQSPIREYNTNNRETVTSEYIQNLSDRLRCLIHIQFDIADLVKYINILKYVAEKNGVTLINVNAICPWDDGFFNIKAEGFTPTELTTFTQKEILQIDTRDDSEIYKLYELQHKMYSDAGGIHADTWVNLYHSHHLMAIDTGIDGHHPGIKSNLLFYKQFIESDTIKGLDR